MLGGLEFEGRTEASNQLLALKAARAEALARVGALEAEQRVAADYAHARSAELAKLHRAGASAAKITAAERALTTARARVAEPWGERAAGAKSGVRDADDAVRRYVGENYTALAQELAEDADHAAAAVNDALRAVLAACAERARVGAAFDSLIATAVGRSAPGVVPFSRTERVASAAEAVLMAGGEQSPKPARDPRVVEAAA